MLIRSNFCRSVPPELLWSLLAEVAPGSTGQITLLHPHLSIVDAMVLRMIVSWHHEIEACRFKKREWKGKLSLIETCDDDNDGRRYWSLVNSATQPSNCPNLTSMFPSQTNLVDKGTHCGRICIPGAIYKLQMHIIFCNMHPQDLTQHALYSSASATHSPVTCVILQRSFKLYYNLLSQVKEVNYIFLFQATTYSSEARLLVIEHSYRKWDNTIILSSLLLLLTTSRPIAWAGHLPDKDTVKMKNTKHMFNERGCLIFHSS